MGIIERVAALMDDAVHGGSEVILQIMGGDAHIVLGKAGGEGMLGFGDGAVRAVQADYLHQIIAELALLIQRKMAVQRAVVHLLGGGDAMDEGHQFPAHNIEESIALGAGQPRFKTIQQRIVYGLIGLDIAHNALRLGNQAFQIGHEQRIIVVFLGGMPDRVRFGGQLLIGHIFFHGDAACFVDVLVHHLDDALMHFVQLVHPRMKLVQQRHGFIACGQLVYLLSQDAQRFGAVGGRARGRGGHAVVVNQPHRVGISQLLALQLIQLLQGGGQFHGMISSLVNINQIVNGQKRLLADAANMQQFLDVSEGSQLRAHIQYSLRGFGANAGQRRQVFQRGGVQVDALRLFRIGQGSCGGIGSAQGISIRLGAAEGACIANQHAQNSARQHGAHGVWQRCAGAEGQAARRYTAFRTFCPSFVSSTI